MKNIEKCATRRFFCERWSRETTAIFIRTLAFLVKPHVISNKKRINYFSEKIKKTIAIAIGFTLISSLSFASGFSPVIGIPYCGWMPFVLALLHKPCPPNC